MTPGQQLRRLWEQERPLVMAGVINAYCALQAQQAGLSALYLSGAGVANASLGYPDLGVTTLGDLLLDAHRIQRASNLPLLVDIDAGGGSVLSVRRAAAELSAIGVAGLHLEDQISAKRCGHRPGKRLISVEAMCRNIEAACNARRDSDFVIVARTDAMAVEGLAGTIARLQAYCDAGADAVFPDAVVAIADYGHIAQGVSAPVMANMTEFGVTPLVAHQVLAEQGVAMVLHPLSAFRAMAQAAKAVYQVLSKGGVTAEALASMETRDELYRTLNYHHWEQVLDGDLDDSNSG